MSGGILYGSGAAIWRKELRCVAQSHPSARWLSAAPIAQPLGSGDPRYPANEPDVLDLTLTSDALSAWLQKLLHAWFPLAGDAAVRRTVRIPLPPSGAKIPLIRRLAGAYPHTRFLIDPFKHGPGSTWMPYVRMAELPNLWLTTLGMPPGPANSWTQSSDMEEAIHFVCGEVGAGKLLLASGECVDAQQSHALEWLMEIISLDDDQRALIARDNALSLFR